MTRQSGNRNSEVHQRFDRLEDMIGALGRFMNSIATREYRRDLKEMLNLDKMNASIARIGDIAASVKAAYDGVVVQRDAAVAELAAVKADDTADAEKLAAAEASLAAAEAMLETLKAIAEGTPVELPPDTGGGQSTGGANTTGPAATD